MANLVIASNNKAMPKLDGSVKNKVYSLFEKLNEDDTTAGLHVEPMKNATDPRVRTARVDISFRAILFKIDDKSGGEPTYIYMGTWPHDEANALAERSVLRVNPINGVLEGIIGELDGEADRKKRTVIPDESGTISDHAGGYLAQSFALSDLTETLGLDEALARRALAAADDYVLTDIAEKAAVGWQGTALLDLATGMSIADIRAKHGLDETAIDPALDEDQQILKSLQHPATKMQFAYIEDNDELRRIIEAGDFAAWRTFLHPEQRKYAEASRNGPFRLSGGAGTGKTVVAIHRARHLAKSDPAARIILTTYNTTLAKGLEADLATLDPNLKRTERVGEPGVFVRGIDALAKAIVDHASDLSDAAEAVFGRSFDFGPVRTRSAQVWREAIDTIDHGLPAGIATPTFLEAEYVAVVLANRITKVEQYARVARAGRGVRLSRSQRLGVWKLVESYRRHSQMEGTISFPEVLALAAEHLRQRGEAGGELPADHVIVDEAQDLHATHWALLRALVAAGPNDLFIAEDSHQRIYGQPIVLSRFGIKIVGRSRRLTLNYRTTAQNLHFAIGILSGANYTDLEQGEEDVSGYRSARTGPVPELIECGSQVEELERASQLVRDWIDEGIEPSSIAVLTRSQDDRDRFVRGLGERGVDARALDKSVALTGHPQVLTMHRAKGMEFSRVILAGVDDKHLPSTTSLRSVPQEERDEALLRERSLLYVAASRARDALVVMWSGKRSALLG